jgi:hypothetical protein
MKAFSTIEAALDFTVKTLIPKKHTYVINVIAPKNADGNEPVEVQVVAQHMIYEDGNCGLALNLPFDTSSGEFTHLVEFMGSAISDLCDEYKWDGIPCFALRFGTNVEVAAKAIQFVLAEVYGYTQLDGFKYEVQDEGAVEPGAR